MKKYKNETVLLRGIRFDSKKEARRFAELLLLQRAGKIQNLRRQVSFPLLPAQKEGGRLVERSVRYVADFVYEEDGKTVVEDVKGVRTRAYIIKRKMMLFFHGIKIRER